MSTPMWPAHSKLQDAILGCGIRFCVGACNVADSSVFHSGDLEALAIRRFSGRLTNSELRLLRGAPNEDVVYCGPNHNDKDPINDPANSKDWTVEREIRAELLTWLCVDRTASKMVPRTLEIHSAKITGKLALSFATVPFALFLIRCFLNDEADVRYIKVPQLCLNGSRTQSLLAEGAEIKGNLLLSDISVEGEVRLLAAQIGSTLNCEGSTFHNPSGRTLNADRIKVEGAIFLRNRFKADGEVALNGASVGGDLSCRGGTFRNLQGHALSAENVSVGGNVFLFDQFSAYGTVDFSGANISGSLNCLDGTFDRVILNRAVVKGTFVWSQIENAKATQLDLRNAVVGSLADDEESWPARGNLHLDGFEYQGFTGTPLEDTYGEISEEEFRDLEKRLGKDFRLDSPTDARMRLKWLDRDVAFNPQPYRQLAKVLRETGDIGGAKQVLFEMESLARAGERRRLKHAPLSWIGHSTVDLVESTVGYGVYPIWAAGFTVGLAGLGWILFRRAQQMGAMTPTDKDACAEFRANGHPPLCYPPFNAIIYSVENCVPLVRLGQDDRWQPDPSPQRRRTLTAPPTGRWARLKNLWPVQLPYEATSPGVLRWARWIMIGLGWLLGTFFVAGLTGIIKSN
jgi:hypothetical protein